MFHVETGVPVLSLKWTASGYWLAPATATVLDFDLSFYRLEFIGLSTTTSGWPTQTGQAMNRRIFAFNGEMIKREIEYADRDVMDDCREDAWSCGTVDEVDRE
jgi:hypothetical protein